MDSEDLHHLFTWRKMIEGWPSEIVVDIDYYTEQEYVVFVRLVAPGIEDRHYTMRWLPQDDSIMCLWRFEAPPANSSPIPADLMDWEEDISNKIVSMDE